MEKCKKCAANLPDGARFCPSCGRKLVRETATKKRGNGTGSVYQTPGGGWRAIVTLGYYTDDDGKRHRRTRSRVYAKKTDAVKALPSLLADPRRAEAAIVTFKQLYDKWLPTHRAGKSTIDCYRAAFRYFRPIWNMRITEITVDDLQECIDDCPHGKRTRENMRAVCGLLYKYGIPRRCVPENLNLAPFLAVDGDAAAHRAAFTDAQIERIRLAMQTCQEAEAVYCMIYLGFRPSEFLALTAEDYDKSTQSIKGGAKTDAGRDRVVTIPPKLQAIVEAHTRLGGHLFKTADGKPWTLKDFTERVFYPALDAAGIENPIVEIAGGKKRHMYTPHSCRHTYATLLKRTEGADRDKQALIGHASAEMLRYYQDTTLDDLRRITDAL